MSSSEDPPKKDPPHHHGHSQKVREHADAEPMPEAAPPDATEVGSVDELYGKPNPPPPFHPRARSEPSVIVSDESPVENVISGETSSDHLAAPPPPPPPVDYPFAQPPPDEPILPATTEENALRDAVGAATPKRRAKAHAERAGDDAEPANVASSRKLLTLVAIGVVALITIAVFVILGSVNSRRFAITCSTDHIAVEQGRSFPPWGTQQMLGPEWKSIALPPNAECKPRETENKAELEGWYLDVLVERASTTLTQPNLLDAVATPAAGSGGPNLLDAVSAQLQQALLLSRAPEHRDQRKEVERLLGDVQYWRASLRLRDASAALLDASRQFETAAQQRPRHVTDAAAWAQYVKKLADDLRAGPNGGPSVQNFPPTPTQAGDHPSAPAGTALPVETLPPQAGSDAPPPPTPDAGVPTGGVLL